MRIGIRALLLAGTVLVVNCVGAGHAFAIDGCFIQAPGCDIEVGDTGAACRALDVQCPGGDDVCVPDVACVPKLYCVLPNICYGPGCAPWCVGHIRRDVENIWNTLA